MINLDRSKKLHSQITEDTWCRNGTMFQKDENGKIVKACLLGYCQLYYGPSFWFEADNDAESRIRTYLKNKFPANWELEGGIAAMSDNVLKFSDLTEMLKELDI